MPRFLLRIVTFLLVPCLLADPSLALAFSLPVEHSISQTVYQQEALTLAVVFVAISTHPHLFSDVFHLIKSGLPIVQAGVWWLPFMAPPSDVSSGHFQHKFFDGVGSFEDAQARIQARFRTTDRPIDDAMGLLQSFLDNEIDPALAAEITQYKLKVEKLPDDRFVIETNRVARLGLTNFFQKEINMVPPEPEISSIEEWLQRDYRIIDTPRRVAQHIMGHALYHHLPDFDPEKELYLTELKMAYMKARILIELVHRWKERDVQNHEFALPANAFSLSKVVGDWLRDWLLEPVRSLFDGLRPYNQIFDEAAKAFKQISGGRDLLDIRSMVQIDVDDQHIARMKSYESQLEQMNEKQLGLEFGRIAELFPARYTNRLNVRLSFREWLRNPYYVIDSAQKVAQSIMHLKGLLIDPRLSPNEVAVIHRDLDKSYLEGVFLAHVFNRWQDRSNVLRVAGARGLLWSNDMDQIRSRLPHETQGYIPRHPSSVITGLVIVLSVTESMLHALHLPYLAFQTRQAARWLFAMSLGREVIRRHPNIPALAGLRWRVAVVAIGAYLLDDEGEFAARAVFNPQVQKVYRTFRNELFKDAQEPSQLPAREKLWSGPESSPQREIRAMVIATYLMIFWSVVVVPSFLPMALNIGVSLFAGPILWVQAGMRSAFWRRLEFNRDTLSLRDDLRDVALQIRFQFFYPDPRGFLVYIGIYILSLIQAVSLVRDVVRKPILTPRGFSEPASKVSPERFNYVPVELAAPDAQATGTAVQDQSKTGNSSAIVYAFFGYLDIDSNPSSYHVVSDPFTLSEKLAQEASLMVNVPLGALDAQNPTTYQGVDIQWLQVDPGEVSISFGDRAQQTNSPFLNVHLPHPDVILLTPQVRSWVENYLRSLPPGAKPNLEMTILSSVRKGQRSSHRFRLQSARLTSSGHKTGQSLQGILLPLGLIGGGALLDLMSHMAHSGSHQLASVGMNPGMLLAAISLASLGSAIAALLKSRFMNPTLRAFLMAA